jgi:hypothetical protein
MLSKKATGEAIAGKGIEMKLFEITKIIEVPESTSAKERRYLRSIQTEIDGDVLLWDAINWICREYPGDYDSPQSDDDTAYIGGENSSETEFDDISLFADAADALGWKPEITICSGCGQEQTRQYKIGCAALFNGHVGDGWLWTEYSPIADEISCYDCGGRYQDDAEC